MTSAHDTYTSPLAARNASAAMLRVWSPRFKFNTWRRVWLAVAEAQHELGLPVTAEQVAELRAVVGRPGGITDAEIQAAERYERELRHDVMAHVHALGDVCPKAKGIIHLGMTSQDVVCNADAIIIDQALGIVWAKIARLVVGLGEQARRQAGVATLGFTHYQPAQPVTVGRRCAGWGYEVHLAGQAVMDGWTRSAFRGLKGATGTQASFLALCDGDHAKVDRLEALALRRLYGTDCTGMTHVLSGQTYPRVVDAILLSGLASVASVLHKIATDVRLLCNRKEIDEPFEDKQIGSSAMPYKRNPMRCERVCGLTRFVMNLVGNAYDTAATQWLERTLDDSSNRRLSLPEAFLALDGALDLMHNVASGLVVYPATIRKNLMAELPFMATENILMACVRLGADRQEYHERIRVHAQAAGLRVKQEGLENDLIERLKGDAAFRSVERGGVLKGELDWAGVLEPMNYVGRSVEQVERFCAEVVEPLRTKHAAAIAGLEESGPRV
jgi:adenylosuccinate lyase